MAIRFSNTIQPNMTSDVIFRAWAQFIEDAFVTTGGWVLTSDTGQTPPASLTRPVAINTKAGFRIYRMNDALQAIAPVFVRIDYGSATASPVPPASCGIWITVGLGTDGVGGITNVMLPEKQIGIISQSSTPGRSYASADPGRIAIALWCSAGTGLTLAFGLERSKDAIGNDTSVGVLFICSNTPGSFSFNQVYLLTCAHLIGGVTHPRLESGLSYILTGTIPSEMYDGNIGLGVPIHFVSIAQQPGLNWLICNNTDVGPNSQIFATMYGVNHNYQQLGDNLWSSRSNVRGSPFNPGPGWGEDTNRRILMRFD